MDQYIVLNYEDLDSQASLTDVSYLDLEQHLQLARSSQGNCVYFRRYSSWHWIIISDKLPVDWVMALVLA